MDVCEVEKELLKHRAVDTPRQPQVLAEKNNGIATRRSRTREVSSRYLSPAPSTPSVSRRSQSPSITRTVNSSPTQLASKRAISAERKRPSTPPSPVPPSTPVQDTTAESQLSSKKNAGNRLPEYLWPATMRSLSVSFQSDTISIPVTKKEKPVCHALSDRTLKPSSNVSQKQAETPAVARKPTPQRKRSPLKGKKSSDQSENSRPVDALQARLIDQHRWPARASGRISSHLSSKSIDLTDKPGKSSITSLSCPGRSLRRLSAEGIPRPFLKTTSDASLIGEIERFESEIKSVDDTLLRVSELHRLNSSSSSERTALATPAARSQSLPGSRLPSPNRTSISRGMASPSRTRPSTPTPSRGTSPSRMRPSSPTKQSSNTTSVLSFVADIKKGKKGANQLEDAHQLRLFYNRYLQWRFANAHADAALRAQKVAAERTLYNVWRTTLSLWDSVIMERIDLQQLQLDLKLNFVLNVQLAYLEEWALLERDLSTSLAGVIKDLEASTLRLPITGGAKADIEYVKAAISSAVDVIQAMGSSICSVLSKVEGMNWLVSELAEQAADERAMLDECEALLASIAALQEQEYSLRTQLIQLQRELRNTGQQQWLS
ncbi:hypothetical protein Ancab_027651 [Ancistrocladus abbreviatus]